MDRDSLQVNRKVSLFQIMVAGLGWAFADFLLTRVLFLWVGARGVEFDWKYLQVIYAINQ